MRFSGNLMQILFLTNRLLYSPLEAFFTLLIFIIHKELNASVLQLTVLACCKPIVSLIAFHLNILIVGRPEKIRPFLMGATLFGSIPCFLFPFVNNVWVYIFSYAIFTTALRASYPGWIQILKSHFGLNDIGKIVSAGSSINYFTMIFIPLAFASLMDHEIEIWKSLFFILACMNLLNLVVLMFLPKASMQASGIHELESRASALIPWKEGWNLLKENVSFAKYQAIFFLGGIGLVAVQPIIPIYFKETLNLSYTQLTFAFSLCRGISFIVSSPIWVHWSKRISLYFLNSAINLFSCLFIAFILFSKGDVNWLFLAYLMYGIMQAGCELSWNLSGPIFAENKESTLYSSVNLALVGLRGCICPFLGQLIFLYSNSFTVFVFAGLLSFISLVYAWKVDAEYRRHSFIGKKRSYIDSNYS